MQVEYVNHMGDDLTVVNAADDRTVAWAAGILEGEGCFGIYKRTRSKSNVKQCSIHCEMTDEDVIKQLHKTLSCGRVCYRANSERSDGKTRKPSWILSIQKQKDVFNTLIKIMPFMKKRRLSKAKELFNYLEPIVCK